MRCEVADLSAHMLETLVGPIDADAPDCPRPINDEEIVPSKLSSR
jgi:hypothetical protein